MATSRTDFRQSPEFQKGRSGERKVASLLQARRWYVVPSYDYSGEDGGKAPRLQGMGRCYVIPDLDVSRDGRRCWVEVKSYTKPQRFRALDKTVHGISLRHYRDYMRVQDITGSPVYLVIVEGASDEILCQKLSALTPLPCMCRPCRNAKERNCKMHRGGMVFFDRSEFRRLEQ